MGKKIKIVDKSGDRMYFTILPNYILNHSTGDEQALYMQMKRFAGEGGICFATQKTLAVKLHWGSKKRPNRKKVRENINRLLKRGWVKRAGKKKAKTHPIDTYEIVDIWQINSEFYRKKKGQKIRHISGKAKRKDGNLPLSKDGNLPLEEEQVKEEKNVAGATLAPLDKLLESPQRHIQIIGVWAREKDFALPNEEVMKSFLKRNLRPARLLNGYSDKNIIATIKVLKHTDYLKKFTLETVGKYIDEVVAIKKKRGVQPIRYEEVITPEGKRVMRAIYK